MLVSNNKVKSVKKISEIRECLGIRTSDNLVHSKNIISKLIIEESQKLSKMLKDGDLSIVSIDGAGKLSSHLKWYQDHLCSCFVILDDDSAANESLIKLINSKEIDHKSYIHIKALGKKESEIENLFKIEFYEDIILNQFGIGLSDTNFSKDKQKWSVALTASLAQRGKNINLNILTEVKKAIAQKVLKEGVLQNCLEYNYKFLESLIQQIENKFISKK